MAKFIITQKNGKKNRKESVNEARIEIRFLPLICCFLISVIIWMFVVGTQIREEEERAAQQAEYFAPIGSESQPLSDLQATGTEPVGDNEVSDIPAPENGISSASS